MKFLGNILHFTNSGKLITKTTKTSPTGAFVFTNDKQKIGKIYNIFGPVKEPYVSINVYRSVNKRDLENRYGEKLFVSTKNEMEKAHRNNRKENNSKNDSKYKKSSNNKFNKKNRKSSKKSFNKNSRGKKSRDNKFRDNNSRGKKSRDNKFRDNNSRVKKSNFKKFKNNKFNRRNRKKKN